MSTRRGIKSVPPETPPGDGDFHTIAGFALSQLGHLPYIGEHFDYGGWRFEIVDMDGRRIDKLLGHRKPVAGPPEAP
jgi:CBS domain containing-hemolysin-like protein